LLSEIIAKEPWNVDAFKKRGVTYTKLKQFEKAVQDFDQAIKLKSSATVSRLRTSWWVALATMTSATRGRVL
jgi:tetratricopeptide (TPR) repeat protein